MKRQNRLAPLFLCTLILAATVLSGCLSGPSNKNPVTVNTAASFGPETKMTVGVVTFSAKKAAYGATVADAMAAALLNLPGVDVMDRTVVERALAGRNLAVSDVIAGNWKPFVADTGVDALMLGSVTDWDVYHDTYNNEGSSVSFSARILDVRTGKILAAFDCSQDKPGLGRAALAKELAEQAVDELKNGPGDETASTAAPAAAKDTKKTESKPFESDLME